VAGAFTRPDPQPEAPEIDRPYFLVVSNSSWRKARDDACRVYRHLCDDGQWRDHALVVVGEDLTPAERDILGDALDRVLIRPGVPDEELRRLYRDASALLLMSRYEGFGWPAVEANAQGTPVVARRVPVLEETLGKAGVFLEPDVDLSSQTTGLASRLDAARAEARANAERFEWQPFVEGLRRMLDQQKLARGTG
jgi:glycosyltransferase involved in cell wall biosynthesis